MPIITNSDLGPSDLYTLDEAAKFLGIKKASVIALVYINKLLPYNREAGVTPVKDWLFTRSSLEKRKESSELNRGPMGGGWRAMNSKRKKYFEKEQNNG